MWTVSMKHYSIQSESKKENVFVTNCFNFWPAGYLRLGATARDKGNFYEASDWFKEALQINQVLSHLSIAGECKY